MVTSMNKQTAISQGPRVQLWHDVVREAEGRSGRALDEERESYLVFVLQRHLQDACLLGRTQALEWFAAQGHTGSARADALRDVGDRCLLIAGLFPGLEQRRRVSIDYYIDLGSGAYGEVARSTRASYSELFAQLARGYRELVLVLRAVRTGTA